MPGRIEYRLRGAIVILQYDQPYPLAVCLVEVCQVFQAGALKFVDRLIVIAHNKQVGHLPVGYELADDLILRPVGILVFIYQNVEKTLLIRPQQIGETLKGIEHPEDHIVVIVAIGALHGFLVVRI